MVQSEVAKAIQHIHLAAGMEGGDVAHMIEMPGEIGLILGADRQHVIRFTEHRFEALELTRLVDEVGASKGIRFGLGQGHVIVVLHVVGAHKAFPTM